MIISGDAQITFNTGSGSETVLAKKYSAWYVIPGTSLNLEHVDTTSSEQFIAFIANP